MSHTNATTAKAKRSNGSRPADRDGGDSARKPAGDDKTSVRVLDAALHQFEDFGLRRTSLEDIARRAGVSRVTIYRRFGSKDALINAVLLRESERYFEALDAALAGHASAAERFAAGFAFSVSYWRGHGLYKRWLTSDPEIVLPLLTTKAGRRFAALRTLVASRLRAGAPMPGQPPLDADASAELLIRLAISFLLTPDTAIAVATTDQLKQFAHNYIVPATRPRNLR